MKSKAEASKIDALDDKPADAGRILTAVPQCD